MKEKRQRLLRKQGFIFGTKASHRLLFKNGEAG